MTRDDDTRTVHSTPDDDDPIIDDLRIVLGRRDPSPDTAPPRSEHLIGRRLAQYEIAERLGEGGMAYVYRAIDRDADREVALKLLKPEYQSSEDIRARFEQEAMSMARIQHENVVRVYDCPKDAQATAIAMELLSGGSLRDLLERGKREKQRISIDALVQFIRQAAAGIGAAHKVGIVHRDIKPANLMIDAQGTVKVADFGVVLALERATWLTGLGRQIGTPAYMSPEQCKGERVGPGSDIYSLGVTLFELTTGQLPFTEEAGSPFALMLKHIHEPTPDPRKLRRNIPNWLVWVMLKCLDKNPEERYGDGAALADAIATAPHEPDLVDEPADKPTTVWRVNTVAIREQLKRLPQRSVVAWACRCARRVQHLNSDPRLERSIDMAELAAAAGEDDDAQESLSHALHRIQRLRTASFKAAYTKTAEVPTDAASHAALAAAATAACAAARCAPDAAADAAFVAQSAVTALECASQPVNEFWKWAQRDYERLIAAQLGPEGTIGKPVPKDFWGKKVSKKVSG